MSTITKKNIVIFFLFAIVISANSIFAGPAVHIFIQPLGKVNKEYIDEAVDGINSFYNVRITVLEAKLLPDAAYYAPRKRYRAEKLLDFLENTIDTDAGGNRNKIILGLTEVDISTTKDKYDDWGILGLSRLYGGPAVVSTFRLKRTKNKKQIIERLVKVVNHELGHAFGLHHCLSQGCLMQDAKGTIKTVDNESGFLCSECRKFLTDMKVIKIE